MRMRVLVSVALIGALGCRAVLGPAAAVGHATAATTATRAETQAVVDWNLNALATTAVSNGVREGHNLALVQAAVFDAVNSIRRRYAPYRVRSPALPGVVRTYGSFSAVADEDVDARVWSGIHWRTSDRIGRAIGQRIARYALGHALQPTDQ
jgi:hypothetical protein